VDTADRLVPVNLGEIIKAQRERRRLTQGELAGRVGVHPKTIYKWESGAQVPTRHLVALEDALGVQLTNRQPMPAHPTELSRMSYAQLINLLMRVAAELAHRGPQDLPGVGETPITPGDVLRHGWSATRRRDLGHEPPTTTQTDRY
jgi:transcriptional regulator with XRE-family HTH domain